jgi:hypothetical protein
MILYVDVINVKLFYREIIFLDAQFFLLKKLHNQFFLNDKEKQIFIGFFDFKQDDEYF